MTKRLLLVDGNNLLYRYFTPKCTKTIDGVHIGAVTSFLTNFYRYCLRFNPDRFLITFDSPKTSILRKLGDSSYKAERKQTPVNLKPQFNIVQDALTILHGRNSWYTLSGVEADDVLASYAAQFAAEEKEAQVTIVSDDVDFFQCIQDASEKSGQIQVWRMSSRKVITEKQVKGRFGVYPNQFADTRSLQFTKDKERVIRLPEFSSVDIFEILEKGPLTDTLRNLDAIKNDDVRTKLKRYVSLIELSKRNHTLDTTLQLPMPILEFPRFDRLGAVPDIETALLRSIKSRKLQENY